MKRGGKIRVCDFNDKIREQILLESMLCEAYADDLTILYKWGLNINIKVKV